MRLKKIILIVVLALIISITYYKNVCAIENYKFYDINNTWYYVSDNYKLYAYSASGHVFEYYKTELMTSSGTHVGYTLSQATEELTKLAISEGVKTNIYQYELEHVKAQSIAETGINTSNYTYASTALNNNSNNNSSSGSNNSNTQATSTKKTVYYNDGEYQYTARIDNGIQSVQALKVVNGQNITYNLSREYRVSDWVWLNNQIGKSFTESKIYTWSQNKNDNFTNVSSSSTDNGGKVVTYNDTNGQQYYLETDADGKLIGGTYTAQDGTIKNMYQNENGSYSAGGHTFTQEDVEQIQQGQQGFGIQSEVTYEDAKSRYEWTQNGGTDDDIYPDDFKVNPSVNTDDEIMKRVKNVIGIINVVGVIIFVATVMILGIKYMMGSLEERASYKKSMMPIIVGAVFLFIITSVLNMILNFVESAGLT